MEVWVWDVEPQDASSLSVDCTYMEPESVPHILKQGAKKIAPYASDRGMSHYVVAAVVLMQGADFERSAAVEQVANRCSAAFACKSSWISKVARVRD